MEKIDKRSLGLAAGLFVLALLAAVFLTEIWPLGHRLMVLGLGLGGVLVFLQALGMGVRGLIVDDFNRLNLQSLITYCWFVVLSGAFVAGSFINVTAGAADTANLFTKIPSNLWLLAGVVLTGVVGNGVVDSIHASRATTTAVGEATSVRTPRRLNAMYRNVSPSEAAASNLVTYRQFGAEHAPDMGSIQQLLLHTTTLIGYTVAIGRVFLGETPIELPDVPRELLALLGVSTAGQIGNRAVPRDKPLLPQVAATGGPVGGLAAAGESILTRRGPAPSTAEAAQGALPMELRGLHASHTAHGDRVLELAAQARLEAADLYVAECPPNDNSDAYATTRWSALVTQALGPEEAATWAVAAIASGTLTAAHRSIHLHNAAVGRELAADAPAALEAVSAGRCRIERSAIQRSDAAFLRPKRGRP